MKVHHIGYLVKNIQKSIEMFLSMDYRVEREIVFDEYRGIDICFMVKDGYRVELVSPKIPDSVVTKLRKKIGNSPYHICYEVDDIEEKVTFLVNKKFVVWEEPHEAIACDGRKVVFLIHGQIGMIELIQTQE